MNISKYWLGATLAITLLASGCAGNVTQPMQNQGTLSVNFGDGTEFLAQSGTVYTIQNNEYIVTAQDNVVSDLNNGDALTLTIPINASVPYSVTAPPDPTADVYYVDYENNEQYDGNSNRGECSITVTQTSPSLVGTFQSVIIGSLGDTIVLSNGSFNATPQ